jgi:transcription elongation factor Elf1
MAVPSESLCFSCESATPLHCRFINANKDQAESVLREIGAKAIAKETTQTGTVYCIISCPEHRPGDLPSTTEDKHAKYNFSCPVCGSKNIKIAKAYNLSIREWYCRCISCGNSFNPRKKEGVEMSLEQQFDQVLSKEKYLKLKQQGLSDANILKEVGLNHNAFIAIVTRKKKEWGISGLKVPQKNTPQATPSGKAITPEPEPEQPTAATLVENDDELLPFITPRKPVKDMATIHFNNKGLALNACALRAMNGLRYVRVTTTKNGKIVLVPGERGVESYDFGKASGGTAKIGGGTLVGELQSRGIKFGKYRLFLNEPQGRWEADTKETI